MLGYSLGSIPFGYLFGRLKGVNVRQYGSGRTGGTNVYRAAGTWVALLTGLFDVLKGVPLYYSLANFWAAKSPLHWLALLPCVGTTGRSSLGFSGGAGGGGGALLAFDPWQGL